MTKLLVLRLRRGLKRKKPKQKNTLLNLQYARGTRVSKRCGVIHLLYNQNERDLTRYLGVLHHKRNTHTESIVKEIFLLMMRATCRLGNFTSFVGKVDQ